MTESVSAAWTDEKHRTFLASIESSFVNQMYGRDLFKSWVSRKQDGDIEHHPFSDQVKPGIFCILKRHFKISSKYSD